MKMKDIVSTVTEAVTEAVDASASDRKIADGSASGGIRLVISNIGGQGVIEGVKERELGGSAFQIQQTRIVLVEDDDMLARYIQSLLLEKEYYVAGTFPSCNDALQDIKSLNPDLILIDSKLQGSLDEIATTYGIREFLDIPIIQLTVLYDEDTVKQLEDTGKQGYSLKPFNERELDIAIQLAQHKHRHDTEKIALLKELKLTQDTLEAKVQERTAELTEANAALVVLLSQRVDEKNQIEDRIQSNLRSLILPYIEQIRKIGLPASASLYLNLIETNIQSVTSEFSLKLSSQYVGLTQKELAVAALIKAGKSTKEMQSILGVSKATIDSHRNNIRTKLGIKSTKANLRSYLLSIR